MSKEKYYIIDTDKRYYESMGFAKDDKEKVSEALKIAYDTRKFEISLYWERAKYFWTIITITSVAFGWVFENGSNELQYSFWIANIGFILSLAWLFVNMGSKYWQQNWEDHIDQLERANKCRIYSIILQKESFYPFKAFPFSVSKINQIISLYVVCLWLLALIYTGLQITWNICFEDSWINWLVSIITLVFVFLLIVKGKSRNFELQKRSVFRKRI